MVLPGLCWWRWMRDRSCRQVPPRSQHLACEGSCAHNRKRAMQLMELGILPPTSSLGLSLQRFPARQADPSSAGPFRFRPSSSPLAGHALEAPPTRKDGEQAGYWCGGAEARHKLIRQRAVQDGSRAQHGRKSVTRMRRKDCTHRWGSARPAPYPLSRQYRALPLPVIGLARPHQGPPGLIARRTISRPLPIGKRPYRGQRPASVAKRPQLVHMAL